VRDAKFAFFLNAEVNKATEEETLAKKVSRARKMAKSVNSAQFKKKRLSTAKKLAAKQANNQKVSDAETLRLHRQGVIS